MSTSGDFLPLHQGPEFNRLMDTYTANYRRVHLLFDELDFANDRMISRVNGEMPIYLEVTERHRYTTFLRMTYFIEDRAGCISPDPDAHLRIYHDARMAEMTHCYPGNVSRPLFGSLVPVSDVVEHRWRVNSFLDKWLDYLLRQGHGLNTIRPARKAEWPRPSQPVDWPWQRTDRKLPSDEQEQG
jgi:uncharacterized protein YqiB (DUF1249 family)